MPLRFPFATVTRDPVRWLIGSLAMGVLLLAGCDSSSSDCNINGARISQPNSVFRVFEVQGNDCFLFEGGLFGPNGMGSTSPTRLCFSNVRAEEDPPVGDFRTEPQDPNEVSAEGESDGAASCNYLYDGDPNKILCHLCDVIVTARNITPGGQGNGIMELDLDGERTPETMADPLFKSATIPVTVGTNAQCDVTSINGVAVEQEPAN